MNAPEHPLTAVLRERISAQVQPIALTITDESHLHAGHAGAEGGARHYRAHIVTKKFSGLTRVARHRLVYSALQDLMPHPLHALALELAAPEEVSSSLPA
jgi:BolA protein